MTANQSKRPGAITTVVLWVCAGALLVGAIAWLPVFFAPVPATAPPSRAHDYVEGLAFVGALLLIGGSIVGSIVGLVVGIVHVLTGGILLRVLQDPAANAHPNRAKYRLISSGIGFGAGVFLVFLWIVLGSFGQGKALNDFFLTTLNVTPVYFGVAIPLGTLMGFIIGELQRPRYERAIGILPPAKPFPSRQLSVQEEELIGNTPLVLEGLASFEAKRRWATLYALGQSEQPNVHELAAVNTLATNDSMDYVRDAARSVLLGWSQGVPSDQLTGNRHLTAPHVVVDENGDEWEQQEFVYSWHHKAWDTFAVLEKEKVQQMVWDVYQAEISAELQKMVNEGWETEEEIGPAKIELTTFREIDKIGCLALALGWISGLGGDGGTTSNEIHVEPKELKIMMYRPKR